MRIIVFAIFILIISCVQYNDFFNPETFNVLAEKGSFTINGNFCQEFNEARIRAIHRPTKVTGSLRFVISSWRNNKNEVKQHIQMYFVSDSVMRDAFNKYITNQKDTIIFTPDDVQIDKDSKSSHIKRFTLD